MCGIAGFVSARDSGEFRAAAVGRMCAAAAGARIDPALARKRRLKHLASRLPFRPALRFFYHYFLRAGFLDGYRGYVFCRLMAIYEFLSVAKARELRQTKPL
jgi:hypothetical protein